MHGSSHRGSNGLQKRDSLQACFALCAQTKSSMAHFRISTRSWKHRRKLPGASFPVYFTIWRVRWLDETRITEGLSSALLCVMHTEYSFQKLSMLWSNKSSREIAYMKWQLQKAGFLEIYLPLAHTDTSMNVTVFFANPGLWCVKKVILSPYLQKKKETILKMNGNSFLANLTLKQYRNPRLTRCNYGRSINLNLLVLLRSICIDNGMF